LGVTRGGMFELRRHKWFDGINFSRLEQRRLPAPMIPQVKDNMDSSNFDLGDDKEYRVRVRPSAHGL
jgi:hypothetical protein